MEYATPNKNVWKNPKDRKSFLHLGPTELSADAARFGALTPGHTFYTPDGHAHAGFPEDPNHGLRRHVTHNFEAAKDRDNAKAVDDWREGRGGRRHLSEAYHEGVMLRELTEGHDRQLARAQARKAQGDKPVDQLTLAHPDVPPPPEPIEMTNQRNKPTREDEMRRGAEGRDAMREAREQAERDTRVKYRERVLMGYESVDLVEANNPHVPGNTDLRRITHTGRYDKLPVPKP